ncbi:hypothetical protein CPB84DRAFT_1547759 [Gymnopilus junonius]|uniref:Uncharacterized protein n=1 Tax=Gymnopilus junonius TaxID=109634 RepID=A0A9P5NEU0_GYMJU|nr:hypothetical protein CPB84DRAFT_1547759 [Gymnopilus junonius]
MERPPTPQILHDPIVEPEDELSYDWYYSREAGGYVLTFGKFHGRRMHAASLSYLYWCDRTFDYDQRRRLLDAFHNFHVGLEEYVKTNYGDFIVPFGRKHRGKTISQCRDKPWLNMACFLRQ